MTEKRRAPVTPALPAGYGAVRTGIVDLLQAARIAAARNVNVVMTASYWEIGRRIVEAEQKGKRKADYGDVLVKRLALDLTAQFGRGLGWRNLFQMRAFYLGWPQIADGVCNVGGTQKIADAVCNFNKLNKRLSRNLHPAGGPLPPAVVSLRAPAVGQEQPSGQMHMYLNYTRANWMREGENPPVSLILCSEKGAAEAHYALEGLPNKVLAAQYQTVLPSEEQIAKELAETTRMLEMRKAIGGAGKRNA